MKSRRILIGKKGGDGKPIGWIDWSPRRGLLLGGRDERAKTIWKRWIEARVARGQYYRVASVRARTHVVGMLMIHAQVDDPEILTCIRADDPFWGKEHRPDLYFELLGEPRPDVGDVPIAPHKES